MLSRTRIAENPDIVKNNRGQNPKMGHHSAGFTLDTYGHLMESLPRQQVEWIDEIVFPEGFPAALKLHLDPAPQGTTACSEMQRSGWARIQS
jgi:hypothetical protein